MLTEIQPLILSQFAKDYHCNENDFLTSATLITSHSKDNGSRIFEDDAAICMLSFNGKLLISAEDALIPFCKENFEKQLSAAWCFDADGLLYIDHKLRTIGLTIEQCHLYFLPNAIPAAPNRSLKWFDKDTIAAFSDDDRFDEAFLFSDRIPDVLGVAALDENDGIVAMAGASQNSPIMWEMGLNVLQQGQGIGTGLIAALSRKILEQGKVPFYGTALSHMASQRVALGAGMVPSFCELRTRRVE